jgi:hypothetical protein
MSTQSLGSRIGVVLAISAAALQSAACGGAGGTQATSADLQTGDVQSGSFVATVASTAAPSAPAATAPGAGVTALDPTKLPLIRPTNMKYVGSFATPFGLSGSSDFAFSGTAMTPYRATAGGQLTLYYKGHAQHPGAVAQLSVPESYAYSLQYDDLPKATVLQPFHDITDRALSASPNTLGDMVNGAGITGLLVHQGRLLASASLWYAAGQDNSHGVSGLTLSNSSDFEGFYRATGSKVVFPRAMSGSMVNIPSEWRLSLGGAILGGNYPTSIISANSFGPSLTVLSVDLSSKPARFTGQTMMFFPQDRPLCSSIGCEQSLNSLFTWATEYTGKAFIPGSRSILMVGRHPVGEMWYGGPVSPSGRPASCDDGGWGQKATGWEYRVAAFDANDLLRVKAGSLDWAAIRPYAVWPIPDFPVADCTFVKSATYDEESRQLFIAQGRGANIRIDVYLVGMGVSN